MPLQFIVLIAVAVFILLILAKNVRIVPQANAYVIERIGKYHTTWNVGIHFKIPIVDRIVKKISLKEFVADFPPQPVITKDNVKMQIDTIIYLQVTDSRLHTYGVDRPLVAIENLTATTLRNIIGELELDESLTSRDTINTKMRAILDEATDPWGIKITRVELRNIIPPADIQVAMEKQMKAERERREKILLAEGEKESAILRARGERESAILQAEGRKEAIILQAEAERQARVKAAEGEAEAILKIQEATAKGIIMINESAPGQGVIAIKSLETFEKVADGQATKIIIPSEIQGLAGLATSVKELLKD
ncbi:MAG: SPFH/Band 7/PHB domain protein [Defluviitaleaceae bacterium]|nr:SPFH/Band 7/PHB domain protein [Defluviitaleaceae bacterium]